MMREKVVQILVVDDEEGDFILLERLIADIETTSFRVDWVSDFDTACDRMIRNVDDVCLVDYRLGAENGVSLMGRAIDGGCTAPVIVLTGRGDYEADIEAMKAGAADFLVKGQISPAMLERSIRYALERKRILAALTESQTLASRRQEELAHVSRIHTLGEMATGFAHELSQPLAAIVNYVQGCQRRLIRSGHSTVELEQALAKASSEAERTGKILHRIRGMAEKRRPVREPVDIEAIIHNSASLLETDLRKGRVQLTLQIDSDIPSIHADAVQLEQVILNLMKNAAEAMVEAESSTRTLTVSAQTCGREIEISVQDSGPGVDEDQTERLFDAFYTTKAQGLGIGLSICRSLVESQGGRLRMTGNQDGGSTFSFTLPASEPRDPVDV